MKNKILILVLMTALIVSGCAGTETSESEITVKKIEEPALETEEVTSTDVDSETGENIDKEKMTGEISRIVGNLITLELFEVPERTGDGTGVPPTEDGEEAPTVSPLAGTTDTATGSKGGGGGTGSGGGSGMTTFEKTGESVEVIIPVGSMIKTQDNPDVILEIEVLAKGMSVMVVVDEEFTESEKAANPNSNTIYAESVSILTTN